MNKLSSILLASLLIAIATTQIATIFKGNLGRENYNKLLVEYNNLLQNVETLERTHSTLTSRKEALETDMETLILATRKVGYYQQGEKRIIVDGLVRVDKEPTTGDVVRLSRGTTHGTFPFSLLFLLSWLSALLLILLVVPLKKR